MLPLALSLLLAAAPPEPYADTKGGMRGYFEGETREAWAFCGFGVASLGASVPMFISHGEVLRPMSVPLALFGLVELVLGVGLFARTPTQVAALTAQLSNEPTLFQQQEGARMERVMAGFQAYRLVELTVGTAGLFMAGLGYVKEQPTVLGVGLGLFVQAAVLLGLDTFAEARGRRYSALIADFLP